MSPLIFWPPQKRCVIFATLVSFIGFSEAFQSTSAFQSRHYHLQPHTSHSISQRQRAFYNERVKHALGMIASSSPSSSPSSYTRGNQTKSGTTRITNSPKRSELQWSGSRLQRTSPDNSSNRSNVNTISPTTKPVALKKPMPITGYDADAICEHYDRRPLEVGWRLNSLGIPLLGWYFGLVIDKTLKLDKKEAVQRKRGEELRNILVQSGSVALIKSGQAASLRPDLIKNKIWAEELAKLVDAVGSFSDFKAMDIMRSELSDMLPRLEAAEKEMKNKSKSSRTLTHSFNKNNGNFMEVKKTRKLRSQSKLENKVKNDLILNLFDFTNDNHAVASASIGQVYKARIRRGPMLEAAIGKEAAARWGGKTVAIKIQRPDVAAAAALDMYLIRRTAFWLSKFRGGDLPAIADQFGMQLFGELDYIREADNCERFRELYGGWDDVVVPAACIPFTRKKVLVMEWVEGEKGPWDIDDGGIEMVRIGLRCSVNQLLNTGLFHADPHRGNLLRTPDKQLAIIDFGLMSDISEEERYGLIGLAIGLQKKDLSLITENLLELGFLEDSTQLDLLVPRLRQALKKATGGTGKASNVNFASLQAELDEISRENVLQFKTPPFFTTILRSLTILEGFALNVDSEFRLVRGSYPFVLAQLLSPEDDGQETPTALTNLLIRLLTVDGKGERIEWNQLLSFLKLAQKASKKPDATIDPNDEDAKAQKSRQTISLFYRFLTSKTGLFLKGPLVHEIAEAIDVMASTGEANLLRISRGFIRPLPGGNGPVNEQRMNEIRGLLDMVQSAMTIDPTRSGTRDGDDNLLTLEQGRERMEAIREILQTLITILGDERRREEVAPIFAEIQSVIRMVTVEVLEIRGNRAMRSLLGNAHT